jgi:pimeloyl-ACP methyl ester carboxylesterase
MKTRALLGALAVCALPPTAASGAPAQTPFQPCPGKRGVQCAIVTVPIDRSGRVGGTIPLHVERLPARGPRAGALVALAGGPGQAAAPFLADFESEVRAALRSRDLIVFDQRGTGRSGVLRCPTVERVASFNPSGEDVRACAALLGARRAFYTTSDSVDDIEAIRVVTGVDKLTLYGTSYGTKVALAYAARYPAHVERLLLDSVVPVDGPDPFGRDIIASVPRVLQALCRRGSCADITPNPSADLAMLVSRLRQRALSGRVIGVDGRPRTRRLGRLRLLRILVEGDTNPSLRSELPAAVRSALRGDSAPMLRLSHRTSLIENAELDPPARFSSALFLATTCEEGPLPWQPETSFGDRWAKATALTAALPDSAFLPFDRATARASDTLRVCAHWPGSGGPPPAPSGSLPTVPALLLSGEVDLRTSVEEASRVAGQIPGSIHLTLPGTGHAALLNDLSACASEAVARFFTGRPVPARCPSRGQQLRELFSLLYIPTPIPPRTLRDVRTLGGLHGRAGRTVGAVFATLGDAFFQELYRELGELPSDSIGGLRRGRIRANGRLQRYSYLRGVEVNDAGRPRRKRLSLVTDRGKRRFRVGGRAAVHGVLTLDNETLAVRGRLGGRRVKVRGIDELPSASRAAAAALLPKRAWISLR